LLQKSGASIGARPLDLGASVVIHMNDLLALALVRKMLLELGYSMKPEASVDHVGALEVWLHESIDELSGRSPLSVLNEEGGEAVLRTHLRTWLEHQQPKQP
jgi:hypothetical protein